MGDPQMTPENQQPNQPESEQPQSSEQPAVGFDWRIIAILGVVALFIFAIFMNKRYYSAKQEMEKPKGLEQAIVPNAPAKSAPAPKQVLTEAEQKIRQYDMLVGQREMEAAGLVYNLKDKLMILAQPPSSIPDSADQRKSVGIMPGIMFDVTKRLDDAKPEMFFRRFFFGAKEANLVYMDTFPALGVDANMVMVSKPAAEVSMAEVADNEYVIGINVGEQSRAYPVKLANYHEVINDTLGGKDFVMSWSALADAAVALERPKIDGETVLFGSAGLLYQEGIVLYDSKSVSLWSPIMSVCLAGESTGMRLITIQCYKTNWKAWKRLHPETTILVATKPAFGINYDNNVAVPGNYLLDITLPYPVCDFDVVNTPMRLKSQIFGVAGADGKSYKAYESRLLGQLKEPAEDTIGGQKVIITYDSDAEALFVKDAQGNQLLTQKMLWIAWKGAHSGTEVWQEDKLRVEWAAKNPAAPRAKEAQVEVKSAQPLPEPSKP